MSLGKYGQLCTNPSLLLESVKWAFPLLWWVSNSEITVVRLWKYRVYQEKSFWHPRMTVTCRCLERGSRTRQLLVALLLGFFQAHPDSFQALDGGRCFLAGLLNWWAPGPVYSYRAAGSLSEWDPCFTATTLLSITAIARLKKVLSYLHVGMVFMLYCETASIKVSGAICLSEQNFPQILNLKVFQWAFGRRI